jgi:hypothetical protein
MGVIPSRPANARRAYLEIAQDESDLISIRDCTYSGPLGSLDFTRALEKEAHRVLTPQKRGPKKRPGPAPQQAALFVDPF